jgi:hypothetical protein
VSTTAEQDTAETLWTVLRADFRAARRELAEARREQHGEDSPDNRAAVASALMAVDAVLDTYLDVHDFLRGSTARSSAR